MNHKSTLLWRMAVLGLFAAMVPLGIYALDRYNQVDTDRMLDSSVSIRTISHVTIDKYGDTVWDTRTGSGFMVSTANCEVWTNHHVIDGAAVIEVFPRDWRRAAGIPAKVVNSTPRSDIAILKLESCHGIPQATIGNSDIVKPGDETFAVGNPLGHNPDSISRGIISHTLRYRTGSTPYLQTDAAINPGNSGGALFNHDGQVIGMNTAIETTVSGANVGLGFSVPINHVKQIVAELHEGPPSWGDAGLAEIVSPLTPDEAEVFKVPNGHGALVVTKTPDTGPSVEKLLLHDVIFRINQTGVSTSDQATRLIGNMDAGEQITLDLIREGNPVSIEVTLSEGWKAIEQPKADSYEGFLGMTLENWSEDDGMRGQFKRPVITKVHSLGPAHKAHIASTQKSLVRMGDTFLPYFIDVKTVIGAAYQGSYHAVDNIESLELLASKAHQAGKPLLLEVEMWARKNPNNLRTDMELMQTAFFKLVPEKATDAIAKQQQKIPPKSWSPRIELRDVSS